MKMAQTIKMAYHGKPSRDHQLVSGELKMNMAAKKISSV